MSASPGNGILKRSLAIAGHHTSISLEAPFWDGLKYLARLRGISLAAMVAEIDAGRQHGNLSSAIRLHVLDAAKAGKLTAD